MSFTINKLDKGYGDSRYQTRSFRNVLSDLLPYTLYNGIIETVALNERLLEKYQHDFYGLLLELNVSKELHWITMRVNGFHSPADFYFQTEVIKLVNPSKIKSQYERHLSNLYAANQYTA